MITVDKPPSGSVTFGLARGLAVLACVAASAAPALAERLPATIYTTEHGLANNNVFSVVADSRGFIWFATREGLSRFDGYTFTNYGVDDGLPGAIVNDVLETRDGVYLIATNAGLARLETAPIRRPSSGSDSSRAPLFSVHEISPDPASRHVVALHQSPDGSIWAGTRGGLFRLERPAADMRFRAVALSAEPNASPVHVWDVRDDRFGTLWVATALGLRRVWPDGRIDVHFPDVGFHSVLEDRAGRVWAGTRLDGLLELTLEAGSGRLLGTHTYTPSNGLPHSWINQLLELNDAELWAASPAGLIQLARTASGNRRIRLFTEAHGVGRGGLISLARDRSGNVWIGTAHGGAVKIAASGFSAFGPADGIRWGSSLIQSRSGDLCFVGPVSRYWGLRCFNGTAFEAVEPRLRPGAGSESWGWNQTVLEDHTGEWWFATREGVARFGKADRPLDLHGRSPARWYGPADGLAPAVVLRLFEDARGDIWISAAGEGARNGLSRWERATGTFHHYSNHANVPDLNVYFVTAFAGDHGGNVWIGFSGAGGVVRYRNGVFDRPDTRGVFRGMVRNIFGDSKGRLWFATYSGLVRLDNPVAESPTFHRYTTKDGFSSNEATAVVEDVQERLYVGTGRGLDRFDPATGRIMRYSARDGYTAGEILSALLDRRTGHLWFAQQPGVSRLVPLPAPPPLAPPILITAVDVAAEAQPLNPLGATSVPAIRIQPHRNHLRIEYVALGFGPGEDLRYQYRLEGARDEWTPPSNQRTVNFANLSPGAYKFLVRAVNADGITTPEPASVEFMILPPVWQRWWFLLMVAAAAAALLHAAHRYRLARMLDIANVRARIATDLHDDIGADLTKIAILSEVARKQLEGHGEAADRLSAIARISRESVAAMSDVVWAINPRRDTLRDTIRRMRQHAEEVLAGRGIHLEFHAPDADEKARVTIDVRRDLLLIFKEALNNAVRHSHCRSIVIDVAGDGSRLHFRLSDDGVGFEIGDEAAGNGLASMRRRAARMNATLDIVSRRGHGTTVLVSVPGAFASRAADTYKPT